VGDGAGGEGRQRLAGVGEVLGVHHVRHAVGDVEDIDDQPVSHGQGVLLVPPVVGAHVPVEVLARVLRHRPLDRGELRCAHHLGEQVPDVSAHALLGCPADDPSDGLGDVAVAPVGTDDRHGIAEQSEHLGAEVVGQPVVVGHGRLARSGARST